jgi:DNA-binding MarR family transcriptional regulator
MKSSMDTASVSLALTDAQVAKVLEAVASGAERSLLFAPGLDQPKALTTSPLLEDPKVSRSLLLGLVVLISFPSDGRERGVKELALDLGLPASTTYRYIHTLVSAGLLEQDPLTRKYRRSHR